MMNRYSQTITLLLLCFLPAACFRHESESTGVRAERGDKKAELRNSDNGSSKSTQPETANAQPQSIGGQYQRRQEYTFLVPDKWELVSSEHILDIPDRWEIIPVLSLSFIDYMVYGDQTHKKARFCFQGFQENKNNPEPNPFDELKANERQLEQIIIKRLQVDEVNLIGNKQMKVNGFDVLWLHYTYASPIEKGDVIMEFLYKDGGTLFLTGTFASPSYSELEKDITAVLNSIKKE
jgi:hypothetical protein